ncbi:MAG: hypothetical protein NT070_05945 [Cyanobacteria bacterium]|nr:hypothetical protein [Cyanobacteriota bacterium]
MTAKLLLSLREIQMNSLLKFLPGLLCLATVTGIPVISALAQPTIVAAEAKAPLDLKLTADQKAQLKTIKEEARAAIQKLLTPEQLSQMETAKANKVSFRKALAKLKLTPEQKASIAEIKKQENTKENAVLTEEQRQKMRAAAPAEKAK